MEHSLQSSTIWPIRITIAGARSTIQPPRRFSQDGNVPYAIKRRNPSESSAKHLILQESIFHWRASIRTIKHAFLPSTRSAWSYPNSLWHQSNRTYDHPCQSQLADSPGNPMTSADTRERGRQEVGKASEGGLVGSLESCRLFGVRDSTSARREGGALFRKGDSRED